MKTKAQAAYDYICRGIQVIPLRGKTPMLDEGWQHLDITPQMVREWWSRWPGADIGIRLETSGLLVVDLDSEAAQREAEQLGIPQTLAATTSSGRHYYFKAGDLPPGRKIGKGSSGKIDILGKGFVVAPPSVHATGHRYAWTIDAPLAAPPAWVRDILKPKPRPVSFPAAYNNDGDLGEARDAVKALDPDLNNDDWVQIGMAIHAIDAGNAGLAVWDEWSAGGSKYKPGECAKRWRSFTAGAITKSTLFGLARDAGWTPEPKNNYVPPPRTVREAAQPGRKIRVVSSVGTLHFGPRVKLEKRAAEGEEPEVKWYASDVWPEALTKDADTGGHGVLISYQDRQRKRAEMVVNADAWGGDRGATSRFVSEAALAGVRLQPLQGPGLAVALGYWAELVEDAPTRTTVTRPGWHKRSIFVNGCQVHGAPWVYQGPGHRGETRGTLATWRANLERLATTPAIQLALGVALSGALLSPLGRSGWVLHLAGASTTGKTRAAKLAASVWFDPNKTSTWNGTANGIEQTLEGYSGAVVVLDEIKEASPKQVGDIVHRISDNAGRVRSNRSGTGNQRQRKWHLTGISTGETTVADYLGAGAQGGHLVRCVDLWIDRGESTTDAAHADEIDRAGRQCFGVAGNVWAQYLVEHLERIPTIEHKADQLWDELLEVAPDAEAQRVLRQLALVGACLAEGQRAGVLPDHIDPAQVVRWAMQKIVAERGSVTSPEERALRTLRDMMQSRPALFPRDVDYAASREAVGVWSRGQLHTTEGMLKSCEPFQAAGVSGRRWLSWLESKGDARKVGQIRVGGVKGRWWVLDFAGEGVTDADF